jgi:predicted metalloprotease
VGRRTPRAALGGVVILLVVGLIAGQDFLALLDQDPESPLPGETVTSRQTSPEEEKLVDFVSFVLDDVQGIWHTGFLQSGKRYRDAKVVLFTDAVQSNCAFAESAMGSFYCRSIRRSTSIWDFTAISNNASAPP